MPEKRGVERQAEVMAALGIATLSFSGFIFSGEAHPGHNNTEESECSESDKNDECPKKMIPLSWDKMNIKTKEDLCFQSKIFVSG